MTRLAAFLVGLSCLMGSLSAQQARTRHLFVLVSDLSGAPVLDLSPSDFRVKENGADVQVTRAAINQPARIALMVDNSDAMSPSLTSVRSGVQAFVDAVPPQHEIVLLTTGRQLRVRVPPPGTDKTKLKDAIGLIYPDTGSPSVLLSGFEETFNRFFRDVSGRWAVMVVLTTDGPENSNMNPVQFKQLFERMNTRNVLVHGISLTSRGGAGMQSQATRSLAGATGGQFESLGTAANSLPERMAALGTLVAEQMSALARQYDVEYSSQAVGGGATVEVSIGRSGLRPPIVSPTRPIR